MQMFYGLSNYFQNHRRYVLSRDDDQLNGQDIEAPSDMCSSYDRLNVSGVMKIIAPCGAIANSLFNGKLCNLGF